MEIIKYSSEFCEKWDNFIEKESINGTFLQNRRFLSYHPDDRFEDASLLIMQGSSIVAVIPAHEVKDAEGKHFKSHKGSTFGGIVISKNKYNISAMEEIYPMLDAYFMGEGYVDAVMAQTSDIFVEQSMDLLDYYYYKYDWNVYNELCTYIDLEKAPKDLLSIMSSSRRRDYRYSLKNGLEFSELTTKEEVACFYRILCDNLSKYDAKPVHTLDELFDFKYERLKNETSFYGVYDSKGTMLSGAMIFRFNDEVFHTQYLAQNPDTVRTKLFPMEFLDTNLINCARELGFKKFSFGPSTLDNGKFLNVSLAVFKEGFGCKYNNKRTYYKKFK